MSDGFDQDTYYDGKDLDEAEDDIFGMMLEEEDPDGFDEDFSDVEDDSQDDDDFDDDFDDFDDDED